ncbi:hypothetical protein SAMN05877842_102534 [Ureibacillus acetophenoni]|uniref:Uncharacterized protein n=1 Tax=Ureibacillus acetophenoni TaxID=614649 RepID=A0A285U4J6_9BACL|nr:hypothetical protein SAMN05877842_102534 [Ureibacillus acetophenoni]
MFVGRGDAKIPWESAQFNVKSAQLGGKFVQLTRGVAQKIGKKLNLLNSVGKCSIQCKKCSIRWEICSINPRSRSKNREEVEFAQFRGESAQFNVKSAQLGGKFVQLTRGVAQKIGKKLNLLNSVGKVINSM